MNQTQAQSGSKPSAADHKSAAVWTSDEGKPYVLDPMISSGKLHDIVRKLAADLSAAYAGLHNAPAAGGTQKIPAGGSLHFIGLLKGSFVLMSDLIREMTIPVTVDFMAVTSYDGTESTGEVKILKELNEPIHGKHVVIIEDIIDTGLTLKKTLELLATREPASLEVCTLLDKKERRKIEIDVKYNGIVIPDEFIVGYGIDYQQRHRELDRIDKVRFI